MYVPSYRPLHWEFPRFPLVTRQMPEWILRPWPCVQFESKETRMKQHKKKKTFNPYFIEVDFFPFCSQITITPPSTSI
jgi:hypothetical protein